jgi:hypothetical protein
MIFRGTPGAPFRPIGTIWQPSDNVRRHYETASWFTAIATAGQTTVLWSNGYYTKWTVTGYVTDSFFGPGGRKTEVGSVAEYTYHTYDYMFAKDMLGGAFGSFAKQGIEVNLLDEYAADYAPYKHDPTKMGYFLTVTEHPLVVKRGEMKSYDWENHTYLVTWRGEPMDNIVVKRVDGFNGDTNQVALNRAAERLNLIEEMA